MNRLDYLNEDGIRQALLGRTVTKVSDDVLQLDDGTTLTIVPNEGCGGCSEGWYDITELNDCPVNAVMAVEFDTDFVNDYDVFRVFVLAQDERIKLLEVQGHDNGYYGVGYWIEVTA